MPLRGPGLAAALCLLAIAPAPVRAQGTTAPASRGAVPNVVPPNSAQGGGAHKVTVVGIGLATCQTWTQMREAGAGDVADQWLLGFVSGGAAFTGSNYLSGTSRPDILKLAGNYCATNPQAALAVAGVEVAKELEAPMGAHPAPAK